MSKFVQNPDLEFCQANNVLAICYGGNGRLKHLKRLAVVDSNGGSLVAVRPACEMQADPVAMEHSVQRVWAFLDFYPPSEDGVGDDRFWWHARGVSVGLVEQGYAFLARCREVGITTRFTSMTVPFSNGRQMEYYYGSRKMQDFDPVDVAMADVRLPTVEELVAQLAQV